MAYKRKLNLYASEPAQRYFLFMQCGILLTTLVFLFSIILKDVGSLMEPLAANVADAETMMLFDSLVFSLFVKIAFLFIVMFFLSAVLGLFFLERMTGPLIRIQKVLEDISKGRMPNVNVQIRRGDYPHPIAKALSDAISYLKNK